MSLSMERDPFQKFRDIIEFNYSPEEEIELDDKADEIFEGLDYQAAKRCSSEDGEFDPRIPYDQDEDWDFPDPPEFLS